MMGHPTKLTRSTCSGAGRRVLQSGSLLDTWPEAIAGNTKALFRNNVGRSAEIEKCSGCVQQLAHLAMLLAPLAC